MIYFKKSALSAPADQALDKVQSIVVEVVAGISTLGAGWIILSFLLFKQLRTFRHQLILGLAISDFFMCANFFSSTALDLSGEDLGAPRNKSFCSYNGFMTQLFVTQNDYWVFVIAVCTFIFLTSSITPSRWIQDNRIVLWALPWALSILTAALGLGIIGYGDIGPWCWFTNDQTHLIINYIPRWIIIFSMLGLYGRLYQLIFRAHTRFVGQDPDAIGSLEGGREWPRSASVARSYLSDHTECDRAAITHYGDTSELGFSSPSPGGNQISISARNTESKLVLKRMAYKMLIYPTVYMVIWMIPTFTRLYQISTNQRAGIAISTIDKACTAGQGFINAIIYGLNESSFSIWSQWFKSGRPVSVLSLTGPIRSAQSIRVDVERNVTVESRCPPPPPNTPYGPRSQN